MSFRFSVFGLLLLLALPSFANTSKIELQPGAMEVLKLAQATDVIIGNEAVAKVRLIGTTQLVINAQAEGSTEIIVVAANGSHQRYQIEVKAAPSPRIVTDIAWLLQRFPQLQFTEQAGVGFLTGQLDSDAEATVTEFAKQYPNLVNRVSYLPEASLPMVELHVRIAEVKRQYARHLGVRWPQQLAGPTLSSTAARIISMPVEMASSIDLLERDGHAKILAEPKLVARSGGEAEVLVGGEFPIPQVLADGQQDVQFREYGVSLKMAPLVMPNGDIETAVHAEISTIDSATMVNGVPGILTRKVTSQVVGEPGAPIVLSGLINHEQSQQADQFPWLHEVPILGGLFSSQQFRNAETELVVIVTAHMRGDLQQQERRIEQSAQWIRDFQQQAGCIGLHDGYY
ncbi:MULTISPECIES: type II and III secretion system protein family protein [Idiomarina]|uniref:type II and III secretion system protein family protein n=1 Tax=Idiomarinaceae TaxID=267893 RepID=UPI00129C1DFF|nr:MULTISPECIES: pilus assembly protein N-terminal domain-containing protein [Idiomarina]MRJ41857.1 hypothetical protein [Idiomarina sp. FeN1]NCU57846.1 hypothetical protein [Idiomarina sp. FenA--70]NCU60398.1 hypothetical protein [Idiomarina sp. FenBw--71]UUN13950.1 pilus assembly protein N-terminal domain-containing protein [Idiomarina loihiensis]